MAFKSRRVPEIIEGWCFFYAIVPDYMAGRKFRYTTYALGKEGMKSATVIGRELPLRNSRSIVKSHDKQYEDYAP